MGLLVTFPRRLGRAPSLRDTLPCPRPSRPAAGTTGTTPMASEHRKVEIAPGHFIVVRRFPRAEPRGGKVLVIKSHRDPFAVDQAAWDRAEVVR